jgi:hypothetical protein
MTATPESGSAADRESMRSIIQGVLLGAVMNAAAGLLTPPVHVQQRVDDDGVILPYFDIDLASGIKLRVDVAVVEEATVALA